jgi:hypothetical protein
MVIGMILRVISEKKLTKEKIYDKKIIDDEKKIKSGNFYENLVEEELKKF